MSLLQTIKSALGLQPPLEPGDPAPFQVASSAKKAIDRLPPSRALHLSTVPAAGGHAIKTERTDASLVPEGALPIVISEEDRERLAGTRLIWDGDRFRLEVRLRVQSKETPNPDSRKYVTDRWLAKGRPQSWRDSDDDAPLLARRLLGIDGVLQVLFRDHTVSVEREPSASWRTIDRQVETALREHFLLLNGPLEPRTIPRADGDLEADVQRVLEEHILDKVHRDGGDLQLVEVRDGVVRLEMHGACTTCPAAQITLKAGVERMLKQALPGRIESVEAVQ